MSSLYQRGRHVVCVSLMNPLIYVSAHPNKYSNSCPKNTKTEIKSPNGKFEYLICSFAKSTHRVTVVRLDGWTSTFPNCLKHFSYTFLDFAWMAFSSVDWTWTQKIRNDYYYIWNGVSMPSSQKRT